jgi:antitoxin VapB
MEGAVTRTKLFRSNRSQALRLPKDVAFPDTVQVVAIFRDGARRVVVAANAVWAGKPGQAAIKPALTG